MKKLVLVALMVVVGSSLSACKKEEKKADPKAGEVKPADKAAADKAAADKAAADKLVADKAAADKLAADKATPPVADKAAPVAGCAEASTKFGDLGLTDPDLKAGMAGQTPDQVKGVRDQLAARFQAVCDEAAVKCMTAATDDKSAMACQEAAEKAAADKAAAPATK